MDDYEMITRLGGGSFADVYKAKEKSTGDLVAIKVLKKKYKKWEDCLELRECRSLQKLHEESLANKPGEENIIKLKQIIFIKKTGTLNLVFEYMETDLLELMKSKEPKKLSEDQIRDIMHQTLLGLSFMHKYGFFHRDMKPENLLLTGNKIKIADFGLAREIRSLPPYTEYVSTRYYRAPECILQSNNYNSPIDIWGLGCIMAEMYLHPQPLFCGANEKEVLFRICSVLGTPTYDIWNDGIQQANIIGLKFPTNSGTDLEKIIPGASSEAIDLMKLMLKWDPNKRATAKLLLKHPFFTNHVINTYYYTDVGNDIFFGESSVKKYSNIKSNNNGNKNDFKKIDKINDNSNNSSNKNEILENNFGLGEEDNNYGAMMNEIDGFDKLIDQLKKQKIEDDKNYEKEKQKEKEKELNKYNNEDSYDINNLVDSYNNTNTKEDNYSKNDKNNENINSIFDDNFFNGGNIKSDKNFNKYNDKKELNYENKDKPKVQVNMNRRGNTRQFLEETENKYNNESNNNNNLNFNFNNDFGSFSKAKSDNIGTNDYNNFNMGDNGAIGSLFGMGSRRRHDKNYEI
jgi:serine/threonine protein kinase